jgi:hypothetical protein
MKTDMLYPNCSELVTHIGGTTRTEVISYLTDIATQMEKYGLTLGISFINWNWNKDEKGNEKRTKSMTVMIPMPADAIGKSVELVESHDGSTVTVDLHDLLWYWAHKFAKSEEYNDAVSKEYDRLKKMVEENSKSDFDSHPTIHLFDMEVKEPKLIENSWLGSHFYMGDGYSDFVGLTFGISQHCCTNEFPAFHAIREMFDSDYHAYDGGSSVDYEQWMNFWFKNERRFTHHWYSGGGGKPGMEVHEDEVDSDLKKFPPLKKATELEITPREASEAEQEAVDALFSKNDHKTFDKKLTEAFKKREQV